MAVNLIQGSWRGAARPRKWTLIRMFHTPIESPTERRVRAPGLQAACRRRCRPGALTRRSFCEISRLDHETYLRSKLAGPPPIRAIIFWNLPIFFIICCIWANLFSIVFNSVTETPLPFAIR